MTEYVWMADVFAARPKAHSVPTSLPDNGAVKSRCGKLLAIDDLVEAAEDFPRCKSCASK
jgi:hypothetical protein